MILARNNIGVPLRYGLHIYHECVDVESTSWVMTLFMLLWRSWVQVWKKLQGVTMTSMFSHLFWIKWPQCWFLFACDVFSMPNHVAGAFTFSRCLSPSQGTMLHLSHCQLIEAERLFYHIEPPRVISHHPETAFTVTSGNKALSPELWASGTSIERQWQESQLLQIPGSQGSVRNRRAVPDSRLKRKYSNCEIGINLANKASKGRHYVELLENCSGGAIQEKE